MKEWNHSNIIHSLTLSFSLYAEQRSTCPGGEMADTTALEAVAARHGGSSPLLGTRKIKTLKEGFYFS